MTVEASWPVLTLGSENVDVTTLQYLLRGAKWKTLAADGVFGSATDQAVHAFQGDAGLAVDGVVGSLTWGKLTDGTTFGSTLRNGDRGECVKAAQTELLKHGNLHAIEEVDGIFGPNTDTAVRNFQKFAGLTPDGIVGPLTWKQLISLAGD